MQLLIPVENQVRELDPKLLLACIAAQRGFSSVVGSRREMEFNIDFFPPSIYLSKSMTVRSLLFFRVAHLFGHEIVSWDEEALVHLPPETYFPRRMNPSAIRYVSHLFAWGEENAELWRQYPYLPKGIPIHITGNPRSDMLRAEMRSYYAEEVNQFRERYGDFLLVNTNFNHVNAYGPDLNLFKSPNPDGKRARFGRAARGMSLEYAKGLHHHKQAIFESFQQLIPMLENAFPDYNIIVRPHPTEKHDVYQRIAARCKRVMVTNDGNVVPWLMATKAIIHNGCTTGLEAYIMGVPAISYRPQVNDHYDQGFLRLPNMVSHECFDFDQLKRLLQKIISGEVGAADGDERQTLVDHYLAASQGPLACERMVEVLEEISKKPSNPNRASLVGRCEQWPLSKAMQAARGIKSRLPGSHHKPEFQRHRYPGISLENIRAKVARFQQVLGRDATLKIEQISDVIFQIN